ncbi:MAG TPA: hypothetical protein VFK85_00655 [Anaeromyxobacteraceae bacterium]|nr:hypothetical protein [Anaeromyxobacteraceae bacterium]
MTRGAPARSMRAGLAPPGTRRGGHAAVAERYDDAVRSFVDYLYELGRTP